MSSISEGKESHKAVSEQEKRPETQEEYPSFKKQIIIMAALYLSVFLITLDQNIISTSIPRITDQFHSIDDIGWYGSAYILTMCSFQLLMGKVYKFYPAKPVFLMSITLFEIGSAVCGSAPNSHAFIVGRAISGLGSSGLFSGGMVIMFHTIPLQQRPIYQSMFGVIFAFGSIVGPLLGGAFTDNSSLTWRWCFYINLPVGAIAIIVAIFIIHLPNQKLAARGSTLMEKVQQLDPIGNLAFFPGVICIILAFQWGGTEYSWKNARIIVLLVLGGILCLIFAGIQIRKQDSGVLPPRIFKQRSILAASWYAFFNNTSAMIVTYYLPIWFQAIKDVSAVKSGIMLLPLLLSLVIASVASGILVSKLGYYNPFFIISSILMPIGAGLLTTITPTTGHAKWIGYQVLFGLGVGLGMQQPMNVVQTMLDRSEIATGAAIIMFMRFLGSGIFLPVGQNVFLNRLVKKLSNLPGINKNAVTAGGATELRNLVSGEDLNTLLSDYNAAIVDVFYISVAAACLTVIGSLLVQWRSLKARAAVQAGSSTKPQESEMSKESV